MAESDSLPVGAVKVLRGPSCFMSLPGKPEIQTMILGALGCNLAWGIIDGGLYVLGSLDERGRNLMTFHAIRHAAPEKAWRIIADALPQPLGGLPDGDLDWAAYAGDQDLAPARRGLLEPIGSRLGPESVATADVVLVPGLAVSARGERLGRGGGSYDRALGRVPVGTFTCVLLYDAEVGVDVPVEPHDRPVTAAASPSGITRFARTF